MNMSEIREKAKNLGIKAGKTKKGELIRSIQAREGNDACFGTGNAHCDQTECCWRSDCLAG